MHGLDSALAPFTRKLLGFSDNRQDAPFAWCAPCCRSTGAGAHYVVAVLASAPPATTGKLEDMGFEVIVFESAESAWLDSFGRLAAALGRSS